MPDINDNDYQYAEDLPVEDHTTLDGSEKFVMFDETSGKQASLSEVAAYMDDHLDAGNKINTVKVDGTALVPDANKAVNIDLSGKVDKVTGKGLSTNDYTNTEKNKLIGIEAEANKTIVDTELDGESSNPVENQAVTAELERLDERKAEIDGYYEEMTVGNSEELVSSVFINDSVPYNFRTSGGSIDIGNRETDQLVGGTVVWNQQVQNGNFANTSGWGAVSASLSASNNILTITKTANATLQVYRNIPTGDGHRYFVSADFMISDATTMTLRFGSIYNSKSLSANTWTNISAINPAVGTTREYNFYCHGENTLPVNGTIKVKNAICIDLTAMFGPTIADYIYSLEQATAGAGVALFRKLFPKPYYAYNAGELMSVNASSHKTTGFNQWDEEWEAGGINTSGQETTTAGYYRAKNYIPIIPNTLYYYKFPVNMILIWYDANKNFIKWESATPNNAYTSPNNAGYLRFRNATANTWTPYQNDISINLSWDGERDGEYEPYELHEYALDPIQLRGIPKLDEFNNLYYDGDIYSSDGTVERKYGFYVCTGNENWTAYTAWNSDHTFGFNGFPSDSYAGATENVKTIKYNGDTLSNILGGRTTGILLRGDNHTFYVSDPSLTSANDARAAFPQGTVILYPLATPTTEQVDPYTNPQIVNDFGTEEYVDYGVEQGTRDVAIPVGHNTKYMANLRAKLEMAPNSPDGDGDYILRQSSGQNTYVELDPIIAEAIATKAEQDGYYESMTVGNAEQLVSTIFEEDQTPYQFRTSGGSLDIGDREYMDAVVGGSVAWNQICTNGNFAEGTNGWAATKATISAENGVLSLLLTERDGFVNAARIVAVTGHKYVTLVDINISNGQAQLIPSAGVVRLTTKTGSYETVGAVWTSSYTGPSFTFPRVYDLRTSGWDAVKIKNVMVFDLTAMFGSTIADYIYSLEQATADAGVAYFRKLFPKSYYPYNAGELLSVEGLTSHDMVGFNAWDEEWESGSYTADGVPTTDQTRIRTKNPIHVIGGATYYMKSSTTLGIRFYDAEDNFINSGYTTTISNNTITIPVNAYWLRFSVVNQATYNHDISINLHWDGERDGEYEPYTKHSYPLDSSLTLRGIPKLDASNNLYFDGDQYASDGTVTRRYGIVDLGTLDWAYSSERQWFNLVGGQIPIKFAFNMLVANVMCSKYETVSNTYMRDTNPTAIACSVNNSGYFIIRDTAFTDAATFKTAMSGVYLIYELAEPTTESADPYQTPQIVDDFGTEEFVTDSIVPVGHITRYAPNLRAKLEMSPNSPDGDGDYIVRQSNGENTYVPLVIPNELPSAPSADGTYTLKVTISNGTPTYSWATE